MGTQDQRWSNFAPGHPAMVWLALVFVILASGTGSAAAQARGHQPPNLDGYLVVGEEDADGDGDGKNETHITRYRNTAGDRVFSMTTKDRMWAWSLESGPAGGSDPSRNYVICDSDCDGAFDELYGLSDSFHVPDCLK
jgi:hypothetical protein